MADQRLEVDIVDVLCDTALRRFSIDLVPQPGGVRTSGGVSIFTHAGHLPNACDENYLQYKRPDDVRCCRQNIHKILDGLRAAVIPVVDKEHHDTIRHLVHDKNQIDHPAHYDKYLTSVALDVSEPAEEPLLLEAHIDQVNVRRDDDWISASLKYQSVPRQLRRIPYAWV